MQSAKNKRNEQKFTIKFAQNRKKKIPAPCISPKESKNDAFKTSTFYKYVYLVF